MKRVIADRSRRAAILWQAGDREQSIAEMERVLASSREVFGADSREVALHEYNLGTFCQDVRRYEEAKRHYETAATLFERAIGAKHKYTVRALESLRRLERGLQRRRAREAKKNG